MRELKFRAWHTKNNQYIDLYKITPLALSITQDGIFIPFIDELIVEQFTGLKDVNGTEIYEGDIVLEEWKENNPYGYCTDKWNNISQKYTIEYKAPSFIFKTPLRCQQRCIENFTRIVVGNIHEK